LRSRKRRIGARILLGFLLLSMVLSGIFLWYVNDYSRALPEARLGLESSEEVRVYETGNFIVFEPNLTESDRGFIFYPGGKVEETAYAPLLMEIAADGVTTILVRMPFRLAVFGINRANDVIELYPQIPYWAVGGHSLGGAMAARFAAAHLDDIDALILWASYPDQDLSESNLDVLSIHGSLDGLIDRETFESTKMMLPDDSVYVWIDGGNHAQFGLYGEQDGDLPAEIPAEVQRQVIVEETNAFLDTKSPNK
jgi:dienelactone hydrolase